MSLLSQTYKRLQSDVHTLVAAIDENVLSRERLAELAPVAVRVAEAWTVELDEWLARDEGIYVAQDVLDPFLDALYWAGDYGNALHLVERLMVIDPPNESYYVGEKAHVLASDGKAEEALAWISSIRSTWAEDAWVHIKSARALELLGRHTEAADLFEDVLLRFAPEAGSEFDVGEQFEEFAGSLDQASLPDGDARLETVFLRTIAPGGWGEAFAHIAAFPRFRARRLLKLLDRFRDTLTPILLEILAVAARRPEDYYDSDELLWVVLTLGDWKEARALSPLFDILRHPENEVEALFGDLLHELLPFAMARMSGPDHVNELVRFAAEPEPYDFAAAVGLSALEYLLGEGQVSPGQACTLVRPLLDTVAVERYVWQEAATILVRFNDADAWDRLEEVFPTGKLLLTEADYEEFLGFRALSEAEALEEIRSLLVWRDQEARDTLVEWTRRHIDDNPWDGELDDEFLLDPDNGSDDEWERAWARYREGKDPWAPAPYVAPAKVGRNEPCPCGSGKKYKKCCINA